MKNKEMLLTIEEAAEVLNMEVGALKKRIATGRIDSIYRYGETLIPNSAIGKYRRLKRRGRVRKSALAAAAPVLSFAFIGMAAVLFANMERIQNALEQPPGVRERLSAIAAMKAAGDFDQAMERLFRVIEAYPHLDAGHIEMAAIKLLTGDAPGAVIALEKALALNRRNPDLRYALALVHLGAGDVARAERLAQENLKTHPNHYLSLELLGQLHMGRGDMDSAMAAFVTLEKSRPDYSGGAIGIGEVLMRAGEIEQAVEKFTQALSADPGSLRALANRALCRLHIEDYAAAEEDYLAIIKTEPRSLDAWNNIALVYLGLGRLDRALAAAYRALALAPGNSGALDTMGWTLFHLQRHEEAHRILLHAHRRSPDNPEILFHLGMNALSAGSIDQAQAAYRRLAAIAPAHEAVPILSAGIQDFFDRAESDAQ